MWDEFVMFCHAVAALFVAIYYFLFALFWIVVLGVIIYFIWGIIVLG